MVERRIHRCAIYTRKSTEDGLEQEFNSLDAQREACSAYILSQASEGWECVDDHYDDGGFSGGSMKRPALERLLEDVKVGKVDIIIVYKVDRLTRSLADFAKIVDVLDAHDASFVSVTQSFNTTNSMGRLTLNVLLSFAQFEREVTGERIRDKVAASKKKGIWMGGNMPMGYVVQDRKLRIDSGRADIVKQIFTRYLTLKSVPALQYELQQCGIRSPRRVSRGGRKMGGKALTNGALYHILQNRIYIGEIMHQGKAYKGEHQAIIERSLFDAVQKQLEKNRVARKHGSNVGAPSLLAGLVFDGYGRRLVPSHTSRKGKRYRYYMSQRKSEDDIGKPLWRMLASDLEEIVIGQIVGFLTDQQKLRERLSDLSPADLLKCFDAASRPAGLLDATNVVETHPHLSGLVSKVTVHKDRIETHMDLDWVTTEISSNNAASRDTLLTIPASIVSNGRQTRILIPSRTGISQPRKDPALIKLIAKAWDARARVEASDADIAYLAQEAGHEKDYFTRLVRLGYLAPDIITAILEGRQPATLTRQKLVRISRVPNDWNEQRIALGFAPLD
ncbi:MAG: recombinase family protein [Pseudomonadota bacterium]